MKKLVCLLAVSALSAATAYAGLPARTGITGSVHDMNVYTGVTPDVFGRTCVFCHTPHNAQPIDPLNPVPLWNHDYTQQDFSQGVYLWATPENSSLTITDPLAGPSRLCMSCHDGSVAIDQHGPTHSQVGGISLSGDRAIGRNADLTDDHPIGFSYDDAVTARNNNPNLLGGGELVTKDKFFATEVAPSNAQGTYDNVTRSGGRTIAGVLYQGQIMTCASCHEVHNKENAIQEVGTNGVTPNYLLYAMERDSLICLSCHIK